jgi:hypothetical protein
MKDLFSKTSRHSCQSQKNIRKKRRWLLLI